MSRRDDAIQRLFDVHHQPLLQLAYLLVGADDADDLVQEAFIRALDRWRPGAPEEAFRSWARTTMVRLSISRWRGSNREQQAYQRYGTVPAAGEPEYLPEVKRALSSLTPRQRTAVVLRYYDDLQEREIGKLMGIRVGTVKALLHQARTRLRLEPSLIETQ